MGEMLSKQHSDIKKINHEYLLKKLASIKPEPNMLKIVPIPIPSSTFQKSTHYCFILLL